MTIGRSTGVEIEVPEASPSGRHAALEQTAEGWGLIDLGSSNGTFLNGQPLARPVLMQGGESLRFGGVEAGFRLGVADRAAWRLPTTLHAFQSEPLGGSSFLTVFDPKLSQPLYAGLLTSADAGISATAVVAVRSGPVVAADFEAKARVPVSRRPAGRRRIFCSRFCRGNPVP